MGDTIVSILELQAAAAAARPACPALLAATRGTGGPALGPPGAAVIAGDASTADGAASEAAETSTSESVQSYAELGGMSVVMKAVTYTVVKQGCRRGTTVNLLDGVTACFEPRTMSALMGPSGSGKTTLLDLLAGRKTAGRTSGEVLFAGNRPTVAFLRRYTGYVEQFDTLLPMLSVEEMLAYTAELTRPRGEGAAAKRAAVESLLEKLSLTECRAVKIGAPLSKGISGGQAKRTNIGIALITNPRVLMLDEPTSGLDSFTANEVVAALKALTSEGVTVIATIHSPTAYAFSLFDSLMMLLRGRLVYFGPSGAPAVEYVQSLRPLKATAWTSEAEELVDLFAQAERQGRVDECARAYQASQLCLAASRRVDEVAGCRHPVPAHAAVALAAGGARCATPWWWALLVLLKYRTLRSLTSPAFLAARLADKVVMGALLVTLFWGVGARFTMLNYLNIAAVLFMWCIIPAFGASAFVHSLVMERRLFVRERYDGLYGSGTYLLAKTLGEVGIAAAGSALMAPAVYYGVALRGSLLVFFVVYLATLCTGISMAYLIAALSPTMDVANAALPTYVATLTFVSGFIIRFDDIPVWWRWYSRVNPLAYSFTALLSNQFGAADPKFIGSKTLLEYFAVKGQDPWANVGVVWGFFVLFMAAAWFTLSVRSYSRR